ncbi:MAG: hypothetical protein J0H66_12955 [Solirubrobacterales bacterium]|nr:hypothetical protein [Solirubrobacterales bacterium]OJU93398.1 MAG: hypothetical protein BGO23_12065 [Solirubrobacterales bacterium 67-14]
MIRRIAFTIAPAIVVALMLWLAPDAMAAGGNDVGQNIGSLLRHYAAQIYGGIIAIVGLIFLLNRRYTDLALFFLAAVLVAWLVFSPDQVADAARGIGDQILP